MINVKSSVKHKSRHLRVFAVGVPLSIMFAIAPHASSAPLPSTAADRALTSSQSASYKCYATVRSLKRTSAKKVTGVYRVSCSLTQTSISIRAQLQVGSSAKQNRYATVCKGTKACNQQIRMNVSGRKAALSMYPIKVNAVRGSQAKSCWAVKFRDTMDKCSTKSFVG